jgi:hypothetical protein
MTAVVLLSVSKGILLAFCSTRFLVAKILHRQWLMKNLKTKASDAMVLTESSGKGSKGPRGGNRSTRKNLCDVVTLSTTNSI